MDYGNLPIVHAHTAIEVIPTIQKHLEKFTSDFMTSSTPLVTPAVMMAHATASAPLRLLAEHDVFALRTVFHSIRELELGTRTPEGQTLINEVLDAATAKDVVDFWVDEWIA